MEQIPFHFTAFSPEEMLERSAQYYQQHQTRRSVRFFSDKPVDKALIENLILTAGTAPSGANKQPWTFCVVSDFALKTKIRIAAEEEEYKNYHGRMSEEWLKDLAHFGTDWQKPFLEIAPYLIIVFRKAYDLDEKGEKHLNYYVNESVGLACGFLISAIHHAGLVTLTHTPSPMDFLTKILNRPVNERPFLLLPVGYPAEDATVPDIGRKSLNEISTWH
ncbi:MAG: nitroreductase family protein [Bacteroidia bacterium]